MRIGIIILFISLLALAACSGTQPLPNFLGDTASSRQESARAADRLLASDSTGPIAPPNSSSQAGGRCGKPPGTP